MHPWAIRKIRDARSPDDFADALQLIENLATTLDGIARCETCDVGDELRAAIASALDDYRNGPK